VIDTGISYNHPDLADNMPDQLVWDAINDQRAGPDNDADDGHGTHVAGTWSTCKIQQRLFRAGMRRQEDGCIAWRCCVAEMKEVCTMVVVPWLLLLA
jgi:hypothetical protein